jgi:hypothetical protein
MAYTIKKPKSTYVKEPYGLPFELTEKDKFKQPNVTEKPIKSYAENVPTPYQDEVKTFANPKTKEIMWIKREDAGKGWTNTYVNGKLIEKTRNPESSYKLVPQDFKEVSLFSEMSYHSGLNEKGKITKYGTNDYTLEYSDYTPIDNYRLQSPLKSQNKKEFGEVKKDVQLQKWNYVVLDWKPEGDKVKLQIKHKTSTPFGEEKEIFKSKEYDLSEKDKAISDFKEYVKKVKNHTTSKQ